MSKGPLQHVLARKDGLEMVLALLFAQGAMCEKCGFGTRATSKNWARCKKCGHRNRRRTLEQIDAEIAARLAALTPESEKGDTR